MSKRKTLTTEQEAAISAVQACNDRLGQYSDHEGNEDGSTYYFWIQGHKVFDRQCTRAIEDHLAAIQAWQNLRRLNKPDKPAKLP